RRDGPRQAGAEPAPVHGAGTGEGAGGAPAARQQRRLSCSWNAAAPRHDAGQWRSRGDDRDAGRRCPRSGPAGELRRASPIFRMIQSWMPSLRRLPSALLALLVAAGWPGAARASLILALDLPAMVGRADQIAVVDVAAVRADWNARHDRILTTVDLTVVDGWKGGLVKGTHLTVLQPGGTVGDVTTTVDGMPQFAPGERVLVFLHGPATRATVVGLTQGKRPLRHDAASGRW